MSDKVASTEVVSEKKPIDTSSIQNSRLMWSFCKATDTAGIEKTFVYNKNAAANENANDDEKGIHPPYSQIGFYLTRHKDKLTQEEFLEIKCYYDNIPNGTVFTNLLKLESDIKQFLRYGVALQDTDFFTISRLIRQYYTYIIVDSAIEDIYEADEIKESILVPVANYIVQNGVENKGGCRHVPVSVFNEIMEETDYSPYQYQSLRVYLANAGIIKRAGKSIAVSARDKAGKVIRSLAFAEDEISDLLEAEKKAMGIQEDPPQRGN